MDEDIETQVNKYWGKTAYDGKNIDVTKYMTQLREKYGDTLIEYEELYSDVRLLSPKQIKEIYDYAYQTGLYKDYNPVQEYYRREVLKFLLNTEKNKTIIDMGCEDGRISQGLALFGKNKVYGIDMNEYAIEIAEQNKHDYPKTIKMIEYKKADYTSQDFHDFINKELPEKADTVLFVQPTKEWFTARYRINELLKP
jgi:SAM-dependent methyltransferase